MTDTAVPPISRRVPEQRCLAMRLYDYSPSANCYKVRLLLANLGRRYERVPTDIFAGDTLTDDFGEKNPARTTPVLETDDRQFLPESAAILMYLADGTRFLPDDAFLRANVVRWLVYEQTEVVPPIGGLRFRLQTGRLRPEDADAVSRRQASAAVLDALEATFTTHDYLAGSNYSVADIALFGYVHVADEAGYALDRYPALGAWLERVRAQPGYMNDLEPYPANAAAGAGTSVYD
jgi:glutathione S-transferase